MLRLLNHVAIGMLLLKLECLVLLLSVHKNTYNSYQEPAKGKRWAMGRPRSTVILKPLDVDKLYVVLIKT